MKKFKICLVILVIFANILIFNFNIVQAVGISDVITGGDSFISSGKEDQSTSINQEQLKSTSSDIYNILLIIGMILAVIIAAILGIKFMIGSVEEQADIKKALVPFVIGCIVVFGAFGFWKMFVEIGNNFEKTEYTEDQVYTNRSTKTTNSY